MFEYTAVTTFSRPGRQLYGERMVRSFLKHTDIPILVYHESEELDLMSARLLQKNLDDDWDRRDFIKKHSTPEKIGTAANPNMQAIRFCHKVFAVSRWWPEDCKWLIWIDADVEFTEALNEDALRELLPDDKLVSYLGRKDAPYTECGFVGYQVRHPKVVDLLRMMRQVYATGELFKLGKNCWHDSKVFDICLERARIKHPELHNLSAGAVGWDVWGQTKLGKYSRHHKGPRRKQVAYGGIVP